MSESANTSTERPAAPPYISFRTLLNLIERMADEGTPPRIDRSYLSGLSGGYQTQVMAALRWLGLIDDEGVVQDNLSALVTNPELRQRFVGEIIKQRYPEAVRLGEIKATQAQLEETFRPYGISGATLRKAVAFYLHAANFAGIPVSPFFKTPSASGDASTGRRRRARATTPRENGSPPTPPTAPTPPSEEQLRTRYIDMLLKKVDTQEEMDEKLLNRIEALLGFEGQRDQDEPED